MENSKFKIFISSDLEYEELVAEIQYNKQIFAIVNQEQGRDQLEIEIMEPAFGHSWKFNYSEFLKVIEMAQAALDG